MDSCNVTSPAEPQLGLRLPALHYTSGTLLSYASSFQLHASCHPDSIYSKIQQQLLSSLTGTKAASELPRTATHHGNPLYSFFPTHTSEHILDLLLLAVLLTSSHMELSGLHGTCLSSPGTSEAEAALGSNIASLIHSPLTGRACEINSNSPA